MRFPKHKLMEMIIPNDNYRCYIGPCTFVRYRAAAESQNDSQIVLLHDGWVNCGSNLRPVEDYELQLPLSRV